MWLIFNKHAIEKRFSLLVQKTQKKKSVTSYASAVLLQYCRKPQDGNSTYQIIERPVVLLLKPKVRAPLGQTLKFPGIFWQPVLCCYYLDHYFHWNTFYDDKWNESKSKNMKDESRKYSFYSKIQILLLLMSYSRATFHIFILSDSLNFRICF